MNNSAAKFLLCVLLWLAPAPLAAQTPLPEDSNAAVILVYHRIGEDRFPDTNIRAAQFTAHVQELASGAYNVIPLPAVISAFKDGSRLPDRTVALTFDGGHQSILETAAPLLEEHNLPYTIFIPTGHADRQSGAYLDWSDINRLARNSNVTFGLHPARYDRLSEEPDEEITRQINNARTRFREETGREATLFAYPFGEYSAAYRAIIERQGFTAALGQQSGVAYAGTDLYALPRFPMTESYGSLERFRMIATALPLPVSDTEPQAPLLAGTQPDIGFTIATGLQAQTDRLSCFVSGQGRPAMEPIGPQRIELRLAQPLENNRSRVNCTLPVLTDEQDFQEPRWRWFGMLLVRPQAESNLSQAAH